MSSKNIEQQSSVEWFSEQLKVCALSNFDYTVHHTEILIPTQVFESLIEQVKVMHKEELHKCASFWRGKENEIEKPIFDQWYNETFKTNQ